MASSGASEAEKASMLAAMIDGRINLWPYEQRSVAKVVVASIRELGGNPVGMTQGVRTEGFPVFEFPEGADGPAVRLALKRDRIVIGQTTSFPSTLLAGRRQIVVEKYLRLAVGHERSVAGLLPPPSTPRPRRPR